MSNISLQFGGIIARHLVVISSQIIHVPRNFKIFHFRLGPGGLGTTRISDIGLEFDGVVHSTMKQIAHKMAMFSSLMSISWNFENVHYKLGPSLVDNDSAGISNIGLTLSAAMQCHEADQHLNGHVQSIYVFGIVRIVGRRDVVLWTFWFNFAWPHRMPLFNIQCLLKKYMKAIFYTKTGR